MTRTFTYAPLRRLACAAALALLAGGCSDQAPPTASAPGASGAKPAAAKKSEGAEPADGKGTSKDAPEAGQKAELAAPAPPAATVAEAADPYTPPFPDRNELFAPPKQAPRAVRTAGNDSTDSVVLMGFANVDSLKVVLAIDGVVSPMSQGAELNGLRVISVEPPKAVLQRGRSRWTASIE
ncbi:MAG: hypothetical protein ACRCT8_03000 [Lacipirellulaceae bacterium]